ncbi:dystrobrevin binding protein 1b isoform X1 [Pungitius pungitius]|uniref:dystrobrevin binding protein 1b isoform X1 n=1 Tax=Pungitius pungitius TaxID=134920 RepID=UPI002E112D09
MRKGQRTCSSSESEENQQPRSTDHKDQASAGGCSADENWPRGFAVEVESAMKRSQGFSSSFSFEEEHRPRPKREAREEEEEEEEPPPPPPKNSDGVTEQVEAELAAECMRLEKDACRDTSQPLRSSVFRPQQLWLAMTRCLSMRWPPCLSINRQSNRKLAYQADIDQSDDARSSVGSESTNESSSSTCTSDDREVTLVKEEEVRSRGVRSGPAPCRWVSRSSPRLPRARQATDSMLASLILEKEMFLRIELVESDAERDDFCCRAEWKLSERTKKLAEGVWLSGSQKNGGLTY